MEHVSSLCNLDSFSLSPLIFSNSFHHFHSLILYLNESNTKLSKVNGDFEKISTKIVEKQQ